MTFPRSALWSVLVASGLLAGVAVSAVEAASAAMRALDPDNDGTMDIPEAVAAGKKVFHRINNDGDTTLEANELAGRMSPAALKAADPDNDGSLDLTEYEAVIKKRFTAANPDDDQTIDDGELRTPAGRALLRLIR